MTNKWYESTVAETVRLLATDLEQGLSNKNAAQRLKREGKNQWKTDRATAASSFSLLRVSSLFLLTFTVFILWFDHQLFAALTAIILFLLYIGAHVTVCFFKFKSKQSAKTVFASPVTVLRSGKWQTCAPTELVRGDILRVRSGDFVPCDARLISANGLNVIEPFFATGNRSVSKEAVVLEANKGKLPCERQRNMLFAGAVVLEGDGIAVAVRTGKSVVISHLEPASAQEKSFVDEDAYVSNILPENKHIFFALLTLPLVMMVVFSLVAENAHQGVDVFICGAVLCVGALLSISGFLSELNRARKERGINMAAGARVYLQESVDTWERLRYMRYLFVDTAHLVSDSGLQAVGVLDTDGVIRKNAADGSTSETEALLKQAATCVFSEAKKCWQAGEGSGARGYRREAEAVLAELPPNSTSSNAFMMRGMCFSHRPERFDGALVRFRNSNTAVVWGEGEEILSACESTVTANGILPMPSAKQAETMAKMRQLTQSGYRLLALAISSFPDVRTPSTAALSTHLIFLGAFLLGPVLTEGAEEMLSFSKENGISLKLFHTGTVGQLSLISDLFAVNPSFRVCNTWTALENTAVEVLLPAFDVFLNATAEQKALLIQAAGDSGMTACYAKQTADLIPASEADMLLCGGESENGRSRCAPAVLSYSDVFLFDGFTSLKRLLLTVRHFYQGAERALGYLLCATSARLLLWMLGAALGELVVLPLQAMLLTFVPDVFVMWCLVDEASRGRKERKSSPNGAKALLRYCVPGIVFACALRGIPLLLQLCGHGRCEAYLPSFVFCGLLLGIPLLGVACGLRSVKKTSALMGGLALFFAATLLISPLGTLFGIYNLGAQFLWSLPAVAMLGISLAVCRKVFSSNKR